MYWGPRKVRLFSYLCSQYERDEERIYPTSLECTPCRLHGLVRPTHHTQRGGHRVVSHALHELHPIGLHGVASCRTQEVPATLWMRGLAGTPLDPVLWQHQGVERIDRCHLLLAHRILHGPLRAHHLQETVLWVGVPFFLDYRGWCDVYLLTRCPLSLWYHDWRRVIGRLRPLCHLQQEG